MVMGADQNKLMQRGHHHYEPLPHVSRLFFVSSTKLLSGGKKGGEGEREGWLDGRGQEM